MTNPKIITRPKPPAPAPPPPPPGRPDRSEFESELRNQLPDLDPGHPAFAVLVDVAMKEWGPYSDVRESVGGEIGEAPLILEPLTLLELIDLEWDKSSMYFSGPKSGLDGAPISLDEIVRLFEESWAIEDADGTVVGVWLW